MPDIHYVNTRDKLKHAIEQNARYISITDKQVAKHVADMKKTSKAVLAAAIVASGVAGAMWWNPVGWFAGTIAASTATTVAYLVFKLGVDSLWGLYGDYEIIGYNIAKPEENTIIEGELILRKREAIEP